MNNKTRESSQSIERIYIAMRHLIYKGSLKPNGNSGKALKNELLKLQPEIYGSMAESKKIELNGLLYVLDRLPKGIEQCSFIHLTSDEGFGKASFDAIYPKKRRRKCYRINDNQMNIEIIRGRSEIYDILTHLTFLFHEADKIANKAYSEDGKPTRIWQNIEKSVLESKEISKKELDVLLVFLGDLLGRSYEQVYQVLLDFQEENEPYRFIEVIYYLGEIAQLERATKKHREVVFSSLLQERIGHHIYGDLWATTIKEFLLEKDLQSKKVHFISSNMHSVMNSIYAFDALGIQYNEQDELSVFEKISHQKDLRTKVFDYAEDHGMYFIKDKSGSNIDVQIFNLSEIDLNNTPFHSNSIKKDDIIIVFDYAFGEQAFEVMDEILRPDSENGLFEMNVESISIMGKAGILTGKKGDIMVPTAHIFEGTADNYPFENELKIEDFAESNINVVKGTMVSVLGTSLQNRELLSYFMSTTWGAVGIEMEGAHYQKAIQIASKIRKHISENVKVRYAYYASDNPLETGSTLASGGLGLTGVRPTYCITHQILTGILSK